MTEIILKLNKDIHENANEYFSKSKKLKSKLPGIINTIEKTKLEIKNFEKEKESYLERKNKKAKLDLIKKKEWFEKFRYTYTLSEKLLVFGKDSGTNEVLLKKHLTEKDIILHTEAPGSPFGIIKEALDKDGNILLSKDEIYQASQVICCFSSQWKKGFGTADAFWVYPHQVTKKAQSGEYLAKGSFMIRGEKQIIKNIVLQLCLGVIKKSTEDIEYYELFSGSESVVKKKCGSKFVKLEPGQDKYKIISKEIKKRLKHSVEDLPTWIPNGSKVLKK